MKISRKLIKTLSKTLGEKYFKIYHEKNRYIIPHRIVLKLNPEDKKILKLNDFIDTSYTWFEQPIVASSEPIENFKYFKNTCPSSEKVGKQIINIPCNFDESFLDFMSITN